MVKVEDRERKGTEKKEKLINDKILLIYSWFETFFFFWYESRYMTRDTHKTEVQQGTGLKEPYDWIRDGAPSHRKSYRC